MAHALEALEHAEHITRTVVKDNHPDLGELAKFSKLVRRLRRNVKNARYRLNVLKRPLAVTRRLSIRRDASAVARHAPVMIPDTAFAHDTANAAMEIKREFSNKELD